MILSEQNTAGSGTVLPHPTTVSAASPAEATVPAASPAEAAVVLHDLAIGYKTGSGHRVVAEGLNATVHSGRLTILLGENGVGKSTLLRTLSGFLPPLAGSITLCGRRLETYDERELARTIGVVLTEKPDLGMMTVWELVAMGRSPYTGFWGRLAHDDREATATAIEQVGITHLTKRQVSTLSDGERQKVMIAKALAQQTALIFLDEPTAFLDYPSKVDTLMLLRRICHETGKTVFLSTHDLELSLQAADTVWLMSQPTTPLLRGGGILLTGTARQLADSGALTRFVEKAGGVAFDTERLSVRIINTDKQ